MGPRDCNCARCRGEPPEDDERPDDCGESEPGFDPPDEPEPDWETNIDCWTGVL